MAMTGTPAELAGAAAWLRAQGFAIDADAPVRRLDGGRSNLTYAVRDAAGVEVVLRRPPTGQLLATAHDVVREARIMAAVHRVGVPTPAVLAVCDDPAVIGAPFAVLELVDGVVLRDRAAAVAAPPALRAAAGADVVDALVLLHEAGVEDLGLADLARPGSYVERQLRRWSTQLASTRTGDLPLLDRVSERLAATLPAQQRAGLVHGDPKLDNCILRPEGGLAALVDWELATVGDPLADFALLLAYWAEPADARHALQSAPTAAPGFASRAALVERYAARATVDLEPLPYYLAFSYWKLACIVSGVHHRLVQAAVGPAPAEAAAYASQVVRLAELAHDALPRT